MVLSRLLPAVKRQYQGPIVPFYFLVFIAFVSTIRSLIHIFPPDGGAASIAGIDVNVQGGSNIIAIFGQWGASQLLLALVFWIVIVRYRFLTPLMLALVVLEALLRIGVGHMKLLAVSVPPPGVIGSHLLLPIAAAFFVWSLWKRPNSGRAA
jgi:hypothetical protein